MKNSNSDMNQQNNFGGNSENFSAEIPVYKYVLAAISLLIIVSFIVLTAKGKLSFNFGKNEENTSETSSISEVDKEISSETTEIDISKIQSADEKKRFYNSETENSQSVTKEKHFDLFEKKSNSDNKKSSKENKTKKAKSGKKTTASVIAVDDPAVTRPTKKSTTKKNTTKSTTAKSTLSEANSNIEDSKYKSPAGVLQGPAGTHKSYDDPAEE